jgi:glycine oxidase
MKVIIVGAGVAGLATGWRLAQVGCEVDVFERGLAGRGATWASAGLIAAFCETGADNSPHSQFAQEARTAWPEFARELEAASGQGLGFRSPGALLVAFDEAREAKLRELADSLSAHKMPGRWIDANEARKLEPLLSPDIRGALHAADAAQVDNRALSDALAGALGKAGGKLHEQRNAHVLLMEGDRARGVISDDGVAMADAVVVAGGAWTNGLGAVPPNALPPVRPVKGQMAALVPEKGAKLPQYPAIESDVYIVPRPDCVLLGATLEEAGYDTAVTRVARDWLVDNAVKLMPSLATWRVAESWAGLRPATPDGLPALGATRVEGLFVATGQFRNGILFAPAVADAMRRAVLGEEASRTVRAFDPRRFSVG